MKKTDARGKLGAEPFQYRANKNGTVALRYKGEPVTLLRGTVATKFLQQLQAGKDPQLLMAKLTGNFKRGNERPG